MAVAVAVAAPAAAVLRATGLMPIPVFPEAAEEATLAVEAGVGSR